MEDPKTREESGYFKAGKCIYCGIVCNDGPHKLLDSGYSCLKCHVMYKEEIIKDEYKQKQYVQEQYRQRQGDDKRFQPKKRKVRKMDKK
jgi:hypothetical protein